MNTKELIIKILNPEWEHAQFVSIAELKECEEKLEAANDRIKRLEEAGDGMVNEGWNEPHLAEAWRKAKEDKP